MYYPGIETKATDKDTGNDKSNANDSVTIVDTVSYSGLQPGKTYRVSGVLMDKAAEEPLLADGKEITAEKIFTAESSSGSITLEFTVNAKELDGKEIVVFEKLFRGEREVAVHADISDRDQTVSFPAITTTASDDADGDKIIAATGTATVRDTVSYSNLQPGKSYTLKGVLMDKATEKPLVADGKEVSAEMTFTAEAADGKIDVLFTFEAAAAAGKDLVVFETPYYADTDIEVADHKDIDDEGQTVTVEMPPAEPPEENPPAEEPPEKEIPPDSNIPKTGDESNIWLWLALITLGGSGIAVLRLSKKKNTDDGTNPE